MSSIVAPRGVAMHLVMAAPLSLGGILAFVTLILQPCPWRAPFPSQTVASYPIGTSFLGETSGPISYKSCVGKTLKPSGTPRSTPSLPFQLRQALDKIRSCHDAFFKERESLKRNICSLCSYICTYICTTYVLPWAYCKGWPWTPYSITRSRHAQPF
jgi:hypothetical protein